MNNTQIFEEFLVNGVPQVSPFSLILAIISAAILSMILSKVYERYGTSLSNRRSFASNFVLISTTTTLIITIVKSSLALSLGLVGALSIVRFRAAIKEPEELSFLFLNIAIGLGFGAGQFMTTTLSFALICLIIIFRASRKSKENHDLSIRVSGKGIKLSNVVEILKKNSKYVKLKRFDQPKNDELEASFFVEFDSFSKLEDTRNNLNKLSKSIDITYLDRSSFY